LANTQLTHILFFNTGYIYLQVFYQLSLQTIIF